MASPASRGFSDERGPDDQGRGSGKRRGAAESARIGRRKRAREIGAQARLSGRLPRREARGGRSAQRRRRPVRGRDPRDRKSGESGKRVSVRVELGVGGSNKNKKN